MTADTDERAPAQGAKPTTVHGERDPQDFDSFLSKEGAARGSAPVTLRSLAAAFHGLPGVIGMHGGLPPAALFPIQSISFTLQDGATVNVTDPHELAAAQQYAVTHPAGYPPLLKWAEEHVHALHSPPAPCQVVVTPGSTSALEAILSILLERGSPLMMEEYTYPAVLESSVWPKGYNAVPLPADGDGLVPRALDNVLTNWPASRGQKPRVLYLVPVGQNPTGASMPLARKRAVYEVCCKHDVLIIEDDAYYYLQFPSASGVAPGLTNLDRSLLSLDTQSHVVRLDSFAKFLAPGLRLGWACLPPGLATKFIAHTGGCTLGPCSIAQVMTARMLKEWGDQGLDAHVASVQHAYARKAAVLQRVALQQLAGLAEWRAPRAGMFLWLRLTCVEDVSQVWDGLVSEKVVVVPGRIAHPRAADPSFRCPYMRISFSSASESDIEKGVQRLGAVLRRHAYPNVATSS